MRSICPPGHCANGDDWHNGWERADKPPPAKALAARRAQGSVCFPTLCLDPLGTTGGTPAVLELKSWLAAEQHDQLDDQDDHHHQCQHECAALIELVDHEAIELLGRVQLLLDQVFVVGHADF